MIKSTTERIYRRHRFHIILDITMLLLTGVILFVSQLGVAFAADDPSRVGFWHMDGNWTDASGSGNNGTPYNGATFSSNARVGSQAGSFDGSNDYVKIKSSALVANSPQSTISAWVYPTSFANSPKIYTENISGGEVFSLNLSTSGLAGFGIWRTDISGNWVRVNSNTPLQLNTWNCPMTQLSEVTKRPIRWEF